jgi:hypothetical protein
MARTTLKGEGMDPSELELYTTSQLIDELMRRKTFLGIVVHSKEELREKDWQGERVFQVHFNANLNPAAASGLLNAVADFVERHD